MEMGHEYVFWFDIELLSMELGYIRYDYDPGNKMGETPSALYHVDINYSD